MKKRAGEIVKEENIKRIYGYSTNFIAGPLMNYIRRLGHSEY